MFSAKNTVLVGILLFANFRHRDVFSHLNYGNFFGIVRLSEALLFFYFGWVTLFLRSNIFDEKIIPQFDNGFLKL